MKTYYESMGTNKITVSAIKWNGQDVTGPLYAFCQGLGDLVPGVTPSGNYSGSIRYQSKTISAMKNGAPTVSPGSGQNAMMSLVLGGIGMYPAVNASGLQPVVALRAD